MESLSVASCEDPGGKGVLTGCVEVLEYDTHWYVVVVVVGVYEGA